MPALVLYLPTSLALIALWHRYVQPVSRAAAIALILLPCCFTGRALFTGQVYAPIDLPYNAPPLSDYARDYGVKLYNPTLSDNYMQFIPWQHAFREMVGRGEWPPLWNPFLLCGSILAPNMQSQPYDPLHLLGLLLSHAQALTFDAAMTFFLAALFTFSFARALGLGEIAALVSAAGYTFCGMMAFFVGVPLGRTWSLLPLMMLAVRRVVHEPVFRNAVLLTIAFVLAIVAGHPESLLQVVTTAAMYGVWEVATIGFRLRASGVFRASAGVGLWANGVSREQPHSPYAERQDPAGVGLWANGGSRENPHLPNAQRQFPIGEVLRPIRVALACGTTALLLTSILLLPFFQVATETLEYKIREEYYRGKPLPYGQEDVIQRAAISLFPWYQGQAERGNHLPQFDPTLIRVGSVILALAIAALILIRRPVTWFFLLVAVFGTWVGLNAWPLAGLLHALPLYDIAINDRFALSASFALAMLAGIGAEAAFGVPASDGTLRGKHRLKVGATWIALATALAIGTYLLRPAGVDIRLIRNLGLAELAPLAALVVLLLFRTRPQIALPLVLGLVLLQRTYEDGLVFPTWPERVFYPAVPMIETMQKDPARPFRMAAMHYHFIPDAAALYGLEDARGYEAMTLRRLTETFPLWSILQTASFNNIPDKSRPFLSFLNIKYLIARPDESADEQWKLRLQDRGTKLLENTRVLPRAFVPPRIRYEPNGGGVLTGMLQAEDFAALAWIEAPDYPPHEIANGPGALTIRRDGSAFDIDAKMQNDGWVVISEAAWPGWRAYVDGNRVNTHFANHAFLGVYVPRGEHALRLVYEPESYSLGRTITLLTIVALMIAGLGRGLRLRRHRRREPRAV